MSTAALHERLRGGGGGTGGRGRRDFSPLERERDVNERKERGEAEENQGIFSSSSSSLSSSSSSSSPSSSSSSSSSFVQTPGQHPLSSFTSSHAIQPVSNTFTSSSSSSSSSSPSPLLPRRSLLREVLSEAELADLGLDTSVDDAPPSPIPILKKSAKKIFLAVALWMFFYWTACIALLQVYRHSRTRGGEKVSFSASFPSSRGDEEEQLHGDVFPKEETRTDFTPHTESLPGQSPLSSPSVQPKREEEEGKEDSRPSLFHLNTRDESHSIVSPSSSSSPQSRVSSDSLPLLLPLPSSSSSTYSDVVSTDSLSHSLHHLLSPLPPAKIVLKTFREFSRQEKAIEEMVAGENKKERDHLSSSFSVLSSNEEEEDFSDIFPSHSLSWDVWSGFLSLCVLSVCIEFFFLLFLHKQSSSVASSLSLSLPSSSSTSSSSLLSHPPAPSPRFHAGPWSFFSTLLLFSGSPLFRSSSPSPLSSSSSSSYSPLLTIVTSLLSFLMNFLSHFCQLGNLLFLVSLLPPYFSLLLFLCAFYSIFCVETLSLFLLQLRCLISLHSSTDLFSLHEPPTFTSCCLSCGFGGTCSSFFSLCRTLSSFFLSVVHIVLSRCFLTLKVVVSYLSSYLLLFLFCLARLLRRGYFLCIRIFKTCEEVARRRRRRRTRRSWGLSIGSYDDRRGSREPGVSTPHSPFNQRRGGRRSRQTGSDEREDLCCHDRYMAAHLHLHNSNSRNHNDDSAEHKRRDGEGRPENGDLLEASSADPFSSFSSGRGVRLLSSSSSSCDRMSSAPPPYPSLSSSLQAWFGSEGGRRARSRRDEEDEEAEDDTQDIGSTEEEQEEEKCCTRRRERESPSLLSPPGYISFTEGRHLHPSQAASSLLPSSFYGGGYGESRTATRDNEGSSASLCNTLLHRIHTGTSSILSAVFSSRFISFSGGREIRDRGGGDEEERERYYTRELRGSGGFLTRREGLSDFSGEVSLLQGACDQGVFLVEAKEEEEDDKKEKEKKEDHCVRRMSVKENVEGDGETQRYHLGVDMRKKTSSGGSLLPPSSSSPAPHHSTLKKDMEEKEEEEEKKGSREIQDGEERERDEEKMKISEREVETQERERRKETEDTQQCGDASSSSPLHPGGREEASSCVLSSSLTVQSLGRDPHQGETGEKEGEQEGEKEREEQGHKKEEDDKEKEGEESISLTLSVKKKGPSPSHSFRPVDCLEAGVVLSSSSSLKGEASEDDKEEEEKQREISGQSSSHVPPEKEEKRHAQKDEEGERHGRRQLFEEKEGEKGDETRYAPASKDSVPLSVGEEKRRDSFRDSKDDQSSYPIVIVSATPDFFQPREKAYRRKRETEEEEVTVSPSLSSHTTTTASSTTRPMKEESRTYPENSSLLHASSSSSSSSLLPQEGVRASVNAGSSGSSSNRRSSRRSSRRRRRRGRIDEDDGSGENDYDDDENPSSSSSSSRRRGEGGRGDSVIAIEGVHGEQNEEGRTRAVLPHQEILKTATLFLLLDMHVIVDTIKHKFLKVEQVESLEFASSLLSLGRFYMSDVCVLFFFAYDLCAYGSSVFTIVLLVSLCLKVLLHIILFLLKSDSSIWELWCYDVE
ncbi:transmembrane [Cystoisospora suis]|uniref:Transmembrane n=1 Tax=Cystoisospora suis TaxID=483139 RepID=A0A2C6LDM7_9APIC|nr:transmembrane [Cystoisospora suis]